MNVIRFYCRCCERQLEVSSAHIGKRGKCPQCQTPFAVPAVSEPERTTAIQVTARPVPPPAGAAPKLTLAQKWIAVAIVTLLAYSITRQIVGSSSTADVYAPPPIKQNNSAQQYIPPDPSREYAPPAASYAQPPSPPPAAPSAAVAAFPLKNVGLNRTEFGTYLIGEVTNQSGRDYSEFAFFKLSLYDASGRLLEVDNLMIENFAAGQTKSFSELLDDAGRNTSKVKIDFDNGD